MRKFAWIIAACAVYLTFLTSAYAQIERQAPTEQGTQPSGNDASQAGKRWLMPAKNYAGTRFSRLNEIDQNNVGRLQIAWVFSTGVLRGHEAAPLVVGDTMYITTPFPNILYALDLKNHGAIKWAYEPHPNPSAQGVACCDIVNRGAVYADGKLFYNTLDNHVHAVDAKTGKKVWETKVGEINKGESMTMAPLVVKDKVLVGNSGGELGVRGWLKALNIDTGQVKWTAYSTGPDKDVLIGRDFDPPYAAAKGKDLGATSWPSDSAWMIGGGTVWGWITYDPEADLIYYGTANPGPWNGEQRPGDNKWTAAIFARDPDTGMAKWAYQWNPHDEYDYDGVNENVLLDLTIDGKQRKVLVHADRNGFMYVLDRMTGKIISAEPFFPDLNTIKRIDLQTGRPMMNPAKQPRLDQMVKNMCPAATGAKDWQPMAYSPETGLLYVPHNHICQDEMITQAGYIAGTPYLGAKVAMKKGPGGYGGAFTAWDPIKAKAVWSIHERFPVWSGALVTAGGVAFYGTMDRWFKAVDAKSGKPLWKFRLGSGINGQPVTYRGPDGRQYIAILAGVGGWSGAVVAGDLDPNIPYGALGFVGATQDLPQYTAKGGTLYVFALPKENSQ